MTEHDHTTPETWKDIPNFDGYQASDLGRIRAYWKRGWTNRGSVRLATDDPRVIDPTVSSRGYLVVRIFDNKGKNRTKQVHRLVIEAFLGPCPDKHEGCHRDGDRLNPRLKNLYWGTRKQNSLDTVRHGRNKKSVLTAYQIDEAISLKAAGATTIELSEKYGVRQCTVSQMLLNRGIRSMRRRFTDEEIDDIVARKRSGQSYSVIGKAYGTTAKSIEGSLGRRFGSSSSIQPDTIRIVLPGGRTIRRKFTPEEKAKIIARIKSGDSPKDIAKDMDSSSSAIYQIAKRHKTPVGP